MAALAAGLAAAGGAGTLIYTQAKLVEKADNLAAGQAAQAAQQNGLVAGLAPVTALQALQNGKLDGLAAQVNGKLDGLAASQAATAAQLSGKLDAMAASQAVLAASQAVTDAKVDGLVAGLAATNTKLDGLAASQAGLAAGQAATDAKVDALPGLADKVSRLSNHQAALEATVDAALGYNNLLPSHASLARCAAAGWQVAPLCAFSWLACQRLGALAPPTWL